VPSVAREAASLRPIVRAVIAAVLGEDRDHPDVEDATHETLRRALDGESSLRSEDALRPWVTGIARHVALDVIRARKRHRARHVPSGVSDDEDDGAPLDRVADPSASVEDRLGDAERMALLRKAMQELTAGQREALQLFHVEGLSYQEIGARMGVPLGTVATWVARGRKTLAEAMKDEAKR
jgi:RNA polymerase sigma-70 factor (ECF subfamily)